MHHIEEAYCRRGVAVDKLCRAVNIPRASYYRWQGAQTRSPQVTSSGLTPVSMPSNALNDEEKRTVLDLLHEERFVDKTPYELFYTLLDEGIFHCSIRTMYRLLETRGESQDRRQQRPHRNAVKPELMATAPNHVWSWDITKLLSVHRLVYYHLYVILDIYSRYVVGWMIAERESDALARRLIQKTAMKQGITPHQLTLHADNGPSMKSHTVAQLLEHLGILKTHNRPYTSNDNPFSESQFKTLKYCPAFPSRFDDLKHAESCCQRFFRWYNTEHYHSGIAWLTPESVHDGRASDVLEQRHQTRMQVYANNPMRFNHKPPKPRQLPQTVYINPPQTVSIVSLQKEVNML